MGWRKDLAIHLVGEEHVLPGLAQRHAPRETDPASGFGWIGNFALVRAFQDHFDRAGLHLRAIQHRGKRHAGPRGVADGAQPPLDTFNFRLEKIAIVARAFERGRDGA